MEVEGRRLLALRLTRRTPAARRSFAQGIRPVEWLAMSETSSRRRRDEVESNGAPSMIRTCDLLVRSQTLYPAELWARQKYDPITRNRPVLAHNPVVP